MSETIHIVAYVAEDDSDTGHSTFYRARIVSAHTTEAGAEIRRETLTTQKPDNCYRVHKVELERP